MRIDRDGDEVSMVLSKQDMIDLKAMFDSHLLIPKYSIYGSSAKILRPGVKSWYNQMYGGPQNPQTGQWSAAGIPSQVDPIEPKDTHEILGKLIRAFDLILENKNTGGKEIE